MWSVIIFLQGKISFKNLKRVAKELGENLTDEELQVLYVLMKYVKGIISDEG